MRIAIDARLNAYRQGGIPQYTRQLLTALAEVAPEEQFISLQHRDHLRPLAIAPNVTRWTALTPPHHRFEQWSLPLEVALARPTLLHSPDFIAPARRSCPAVVTIHDLAFLHYPEILDAAAKAYYGRVKTNAPRANGIIAVSEATRQDIAQFLDIPIEQIDVIYEAAAPLFQPQELRHGEARVLNATPVAAKSFMLFVSTLEPRKNLPTLLQALRICLDRRPDVDYRLVVAGRRGWRDEAIFETVRDLRLGDHVLFADGAGQYDLRWLYNACRIYINPSLYEGFGLPLLEAMACGAACLAAATSSLPEIGGDAAIYVPPLEADLWADEIAALWDDSERQAELGRLGVARARQFSWLRAARETLKVYRRAVAGEPQIAVATPALPPVEYIPAATPTARARPAREPGAPRACLRCGTDMVAGALQRGILVQAPDAERKDSPTAARVFACPCCGHVELVAEWAAPKPAQPANEAPGSMQAAFATELEMERSQTSGADSSVAEDEVAGAREALEIGASEEHPAEPAADASPASLEAATLPEQAIESAIGGAEVPTMGSPAGGAEAPTVETPSDSVAAAGAEHEAVAGERDEPSQPDEEPPLPADPTADGLAANGAQPPPAKKGRASRAKQAPDPNAPAPRRQSRSKRK